MDEDYTDDDALDFLSTHGWLPLALADRPGFVDAYNALFDEAGRFFDLPEDSDQKTTYQAATGALASEEGYSKIPDEKCILTVKTAQHCPSSLRPRVQNAWDLTGTFMRDMLENIAQTLELNPDVFDPFVLKCAKLPVEQRTPTLLRMFRYDRPDGKEAKVNAEKHKDLGLLSLVVGHSPGLQAMSADTGMWVSVEDESALPDDARVRSGGLTATLLVGETLAFLSRGQYRAGIHRVVCDPPSPANKMDPYRFSIVYTLRPAIAPINTRDFESDVTGMFDEDEKAENESSANLFTRIRRTHWNVNVAPEIRDKQREEQRKRVGNECLI